ncbi:hypothetical protein D3C85_1208780 [compost metagenome]
MLAALKLSDVCGHGVARADRLAGAAAGIDRHDLGVRPGDLVLSVGIALGQAVDDLRGGHQGSISGALQHNRGVGLGVGRARRVAMQLGAVSQRVVPVRQVANSLGNGQEVHGPIVRLQLQDRLEHGPVVREEKIIRLQVGGQHVDQLRSDQHGAQHALLGFLAVGFSGHRRASNTEGAFLSTWSRSAIKPLAFWPAQAFDVAAAAKNRRQ